MHIIQGSQNGNMILYIFILSNTLKTTIFTTQQINDNLVALFPMQRSIYNKDSSYF